MVKYKITYRGGGSTRRLFINGRYFWRGQGVVLDEEEINFFINKPESFQVIKITPMQKMAEKITKLQKAKSKKKSPPIPTTKKELQELRKNELITICERLGIKTYGVTKTILVRNILKKIRE